MTAANLRKFEAELKHILGECSCKPTSKTCQYFKIIDKSNPAKAQHLAIVKLLIKLESK